jgi:SAM-dependent methyltransferase
MSGGRIARREEGRKRSRDRGHDEERPDLEEDVDDAAGGGERVPDLRGDGQELDGREEDGIAEGVDLGEARMALEHPDEHAADRVDDKGREQREQDPRDQPSVPPLPAGQLGDLFAQHPRSFGDEPDGMVASALALPDFVRCPTCRGSLDESLACRTCNRRYEEVDGIPSLLDPAAPGIEAKLREVAAWPELAREQGWYEADDSIDAALPFLNRDLGWQDRAWGATEHGFGLLLDRYVEPGMRVLEVGAAKSWASHHLVPRGCEYTACDLVVDPLIGLGRGAFFEERVGPYLRIQADGERLPFAGASFDLVFCVATLHHALDLGAMVGELARVARKGAVVAALNEGTRAPYRGGSNPEQEREKKLGINEHVHTMWAYLWEFARARLRPLRLEYAEGPAELARRKIAGKLLRVGELPATLWALNAYPYAGLSLYARRR